MNIAKLNETIEYILETIEPDYLRWRITDGYGSKDINGIVRYDGVVILEPETKNKVLGTVDFENLDPMDDELIYYIAHCLYQILLKYSKRRILGLFPKNISEARIEVPDDAWYVFIRDNKFVWEKQVKLITGSQYHI